MRNHDLQHCSFFTSCQNDEQGVGLGQGSKSRRALWVWLHPAAAEQFEEEVMGVVRRLALRVECENLRGEMSRFQVRGPMAHVMVSWVLQLVDSQDILEVRKAQLWKRMRDLGPAACVGGNDAIMLTCRDPRTLSPLAHHSARAQKPVILSTSSTHTSGARMGECKPWLASAAADTKHICVMGCFGLLRADGLRQRRKVKCTCDGRRA